MKCVHLWFSSVTCVFCLLLYREQDWALWQHLGLVQLSCAATQALTHSNVAKWEKLLSLEKVCFTFCGSACVPPHVLHVCNPSCCICALIVFKPIYGVIFSFSQLLLFSEILVV